MNEKNKIEALLFASAQRMTVEDIAKITGLRDTDKIKEMLNELKMDFESRGASMILHEENGYWKLTVKDHYMPMLQKVLTQAELDRPLMETLAVIAWKFPVLQADVVKIRHNKAYEHLKQLDELGFISRNKFGRTNKISLTQKFFEYFDLPTKEQAKEVFRNIVPEKIRENVIKSEEEIDEAEKKIEIAKLKQEEMKKEKEKREEPSPDVPTPEIKPHPEHHVPNIEPEVPSPDLPKPEIKKEGEKNVSTETKKIEDLHASKSDSDFEMSEVQEQDEVSESDSESREKE